mmetsp:Transcript_5716/g.11968  ORF Transcript_5716/g.11968 Transcript_5716/m.11968 type:complete len:408 (-) Transcript_5716:521-1744(-)
MLVPLVLFALSQHAPKPDTDGRPAKTLPVVRLNLDLPPEERWKSLVAPYKTQWAAVLEYLQSAVPRWAIPIAETIAGDLPKYFGDLGLEMQGAAEALEVNKGLVVVMNLMMQLESLGLNCSNWNETGPTVPDDPGCMAVDPTQEWCYCHKAKHAGELPSDGVLRPPPRTGPGLCTSVVAQDAEGHMVHARNLDWNLPAPMRQLLWDVDFVRNGSVIARGTGGVGFVGTYNGMVTGGYSVTIDARGKGGKIWDNFKQALLHHSVTPSQLLRITLETCTDYDCAVSELSSKALIDENYYIVAGTASGQGAVIARGRTKADDVWRVNASETAGWYRLQTNYDHWNPVPVADDRRTPGYAMMDWLGPSRATLSHLFDVLRTPPTFNGHTDYSALLDPRRGIYNSTVWLDAD